jgi:hypothetical protein
METKESLFEVKDDVVEVSPVQAEDEMVDLLVEDPQEERDIPVAEEPDYRVLVFVGVPDKEDDRGSGYRVAENIEPPSFDPVVKQGDENGDPHQVGKKGGVFGSEKALVAVHSKLPVNPSTSSGQAVYGLQ